MELVASLSCTPLNPILKQLKPMQTFTPHFNIIVSPMSPKRSLLGPHDNALYAYVISPTRGNPRPHHSP
jgi:hypothetical protein